MNLKSTPKQFWVLKNMENAAFNAIETDGFVNTYFLYEKSRLILF